MSSIENFLAKINKSDGCWFWTGAKSGDGYGNFWLADTCIRAHKFAYEFFVAPIPKGLEIDHLCNNRDCVNPDHLQAISHKENVLKSTGPTAKNKTKTHCKHGHEFTEKNTITNSKGHRACRACKETHKRSEEQQHPKITTHRELAKLIENRRVLLLNSFGKDSAVCLHWLATFAKPDKIIALHCQFLAPHPGDALYLDYQKRKYPHVEFISAPNPNELSNIANGIWQAPLDTLKEINHWEYEEFEFEKHTLEIAAQYACEFVCLGNSKYESMARAITFYKKGLRQGNSIFPLGLLTKEQIYSIIKTDKIKLHPCYKTGPTTIDTIAYYKLRSSFLIYPEYKKAVQSFYPMVVLDEYRYEKLFKKN